MIKLNDKTNCCGCNACGDVCPMQAIRNISDKEGFWYPEVIMQKCVDCGLCEKVCPFINEHAPKSPLAVYAAKNPVEEVRFLSSSGGIFSMLMQQTIEEGGIVFGAAFDKSWNVCHSWAKTVDDALKFRGSKYVQSKLEGCYKAVRDFLIQGRKILFSGTACQVSALKLYLGKEYENLLTVDVVCHGVPSPGIWKDYLSLVNNSCSITGINFRDKRSGWKNYDVSIQYSDGSEKKESHLSNLYMLGFLNNLYLRPSCHNCKVKAGKCGSDVTLGDFWGIEKIEPDMNDDLGVSLLLVNTSKGINIMKKLPITITQVQYDLATKGNPCLVHSLPVNKLRSVFMNEYQLKGFNSAITTVIKRIQPSLFTKILRKIERTLLYK